MLSADEITTSVRKIVTSIAYLFYGGLGGVLSYLFYNMQEDRPFKFGLFCTYLFAGAVVGLWAGSILPTGLSGRDALIGMSGYLAFLFLDMIQYNAKKIFKRIFRP